MDLAKIGLPLQIGGFAVGLIGIANHKVLIVGFLIHLVGDAFFFFAMKAKGCL